MDDQSLRNVLAILRALHASDQTITPMTFIQQLGGGSPGPATINRIAACICDQIAQARVVIGSSALADEAKSGLYSGLDLLENIFSQDRLHTQLVQHSASFASHIGNLVILLSAAGITTDQTAPKEAIDLAGEIDSFMAEFEDPAIDPAVKEVAKKHLFVLSTFLRQIPIFGLEDAMAAYFELVSKLRRADSRSSPESKTALDRLMVQVKTWGERIKTIDEAYNSGANLIARAQVLTPMLQYVPGLG